jgi:hypothetical protein
MSLVGEHAAVDIDRSTFDKSTALCIIYNQFDRFETLAMITFRGLVLVLSSLLLIVIEKEH